MFDLMNACKAPVLRRIICGALSVPIAICLPKAAAFAHAGDQAFVLLLPTGVYMAAGVATVAVTVVLLALFPQVGRRSFFSTAMVIRTPTSWNTQLPSVVVFLGLAALVAIGFTGSRDPSANPLPLFVWTVWWIALVSLAAILGDFWRFLNPWSGPHSILNALTEQQTVINLPSYLGIWPGVAAFSALALFLLADLAPTDPARLASVVLVYGMITLAGMILCGSEAWLSRCEALTILMRHYGSVAPIAIRGGFIKIGLPGWQLVRTETLPVSSAIFVLLLLGTGSFDGLNETFWWLNLIGINPLEFPGRSAVFWQTILGFFLTNGLLIGTFGLCIWVGLAMVGEQGSFANTSGRLVLSILPIAAGYHIGHYLTSFLVDIQYTVAAISDPFANGSDFLGLGTFYVTTGFFKTQQSVRLIWLTQAGAIVLGHVLSVLIAHAIAKDLFGDGKKAVIGLMPLSLFMILYTLFGLWLLASPRGA